jgi:hypothetical protein
MTKEQWERQRNRGTEEQRETQPNRDT